MCERAIAARVRSILSVLPLLVLTATGLRGIDLPPTDYEYTWIERQQINFLNQQLVVDVEPAIGFGNWEEAEKLLRQALENDPHSNLLKGRLLTVLAEAGKNREALAMAYPLLEKYPRHPPLISFIGNVETAAGNREAADKAWTYLFALPNVPDTDRLYAAKSLYFQAVERRDRKLALDLSRTWAKLEPTYQSNLQYASSLWKSGQQEESFRTLEKAVRLAKPSEKDEARFYLAYTFLKVGKPSEAEALFQEVATGSNDRGNRRRASMQLAYLKLSEGRSEVARQWLENAAVDGPKDEEWKELYSQTVIGEDRIESTLAAVGEVFDADQASFLLLLSFQFLKNGYEGLAYHFILKAASKPGLPERSMADYWANRAYMAEKQDDYADALESINRALAREPARVDWKIVRVRSLFMLGESRRAIEAADALQKEVRALPASAENNRIRDEAIDLIANSYLASEEYRQTLRTADEFADVYGGKGLYRAIALAHYHLGEYEASEEAFQEYFRLEPDPVREVWMEYGFLQEKRKEWDLAAQSFSRAVQYNPYDLRSWKTLTYVLVKAVDNDQAVDAARATIDLEEETLPSAEGRDRRAIEQSLLNFKKLVGDIQKTWGFQGFANYNEFIPNGNDVFVTRDAGLPAELGGQVSYRPPWIGFRDYRTFDLFLRAFAQFEDNTIKPNHDTWQGGIGGEWKPFKTLNYATSFEYLFKIGSESREGWLWRNRAGLALGDYPREDETWWTTVVLYGEASWLWDREWEEQELALFTENRAGISWRLAENLSLTFPQVQGTIRYVVREYTDRSSYLFGGLGANLRLSDREADYTTNQWYVDLFLHYNWGWFLDEDARATGSRFDGWAAGLRFYR